MKKINDKSMEKILRDTQHNKKIKEIFLNLLAKQKAKKKDWSVLRSYTLPITKEIKPGVDDVY
jgi:hypothetical protein